MHKRLAKKGREKMKKFLCNVLIMCYSTQSVASAENEKKANIDKSSFAYTLLNTALAPYCAPDVIKIIHGYCDQPYAFAAYRNDYHEQNGQEILYMRMSPGEQEIALCGEYPSARSSTLSVVGAEDGTTYDDYVRKDCLITDCAWAHDLSRLVIGCYPFHVVDLLINDSIPSGYESMPVEACIPKTCRTYNGSPQYIVNIRSSPPVGGEEASPKTVVVTNRDGKSSMDSKNNMIFHYYQGPPADSKHLPMSNSTFLANNKLLYFCKAAKTVIISQLDEEGYYPIRNQSRMIHDTASVDVTLSTPIFGKTNGNIDCLSPEGSHTFMTLRAFADSPVDMVSASHDVITAASYYTIKAFSRTTRACIMTYEHPSSVVPSMMKVAPDGKHLAYAAGKALHILSLQADAKEREVQCQLFDQPIKDMYYGHDNGIYAAAGGIFTKFMQ